MNEVSLRVSAEDLLRQATAPPNRGWATSGDALACLDQLARNQASAVNALKFLHELNVYQVKLALLYEQLEQNRRELAEQLEHYVELFDRARGALLGTDVNGIVADANPRAVCLLGTDIEHLVGRSTTFY